MQGSQRTNRVPHPALVGCAITSIDLHAQRNQRPKCCQRIQGSAAALRQVGIAPRMNMLCLHASRAIFSREQPEC